MAQGWGFPIRHRATPSHHPAICPAISLGFSHGNQPSSDPAIAIGVPPLVEASMAATTEFSLIVQDPRF